MPLILAIEPDHRQAAQIASIARDRVDADLVLAHTTEGALDVIGDRVPDLVLVPALLSPQDDAALAAALRVIAAAANVRTLTIPVFATAAKAPAARGVLGRWRRAREAQAPDGCDPAVFAEQICAYLEERAAARAEVPPAPPPAAKPVQQVEAAPPHIETAPAPFAAPPVMEAFAVPVDERPIVFEAPIAQDETVDADAPIEDEATEEIDLSLELDAPEAATGVAAIEEEPAAVDAPADFVVCDEPVVEAVAPVAALSAVEGPKWDEPITADEPALSDVEEPMQVDDPITVDEPLDPRDLPVFPPPRPFEPWVPMSCGVERLWPPIEGMVVEEERAERTEWSALIASLRQDMERRRDTPDPEPVVRKTSRRVAKPVQDEWGFFDPEQCGFAALLAKLDEITGSHNV